MWTLILVVPAPQKIHTRDIRMANHTGHLSASATITQWNAMRRVVLVVMVQVGLGKALTREERPIEFRVPRHWGIARRCKRHDGDVQVEAAYGAWEDGEDHSAGVASSKGVWWAEEAYLCALVGRAGAVEAEDPGCVGYWFD
ncbi:hypothetical protein PV11_08545 [Exophiala sideris]|uniref:Uncharacterized protein n=1 Tax=Exophiala sideris TaxID=1016849 RepID=A0A0D1Z2L3_9EURO|nr:hypothetical protein PV11_08545 [Exophiala sideris]